MVLIEAGPRVLAGFDVGLASYAQRSLEDIGVEVVLNRPVSDCTPEGVVFDGERLAARTIIWAAGVQARRPPPGSARRRTAPDGWRCCPTLPRRATRTSS